MSKEKIKTALKPGYILASSRCRYRLEAFLGAGGFEYSGLDTFTPQVDVYAICATILYLLTGKRPVKSDAMTASVILEALPSDTPQNVKDALVRGLRKDKEIERSP